MTAIALDPAFLAEFEAGLNPLDPPGSAIPAQVLGYGEISTVLVIPDAPQPGLAFKRMPMFDSAAEAAAYEALYADWVDVVQGQIGVNVLPGRLYRAEFERRGLAPVNLSRALEDAGTLTSPLVPWNSCGAYMAATLGVATTAYLPFCFFNLLNPLIAATFAVIGFQVKHLVTQSKAA